MARAYFSLARIRMMTIVLDTLKTTSRFATILLYTMKPHHALLLRNAPATRLAWLCYELTVYFPDNFIERFASEKGKTLGVECHHVLHPPFKHEAGGLLPRAE